MPLPHARSVIGLQDGTDDVTGQLNPPLESVAVSRHLKPAATVPCCATVERPVHQGAHCQLVAEADLQAQKKHYNHTVNHNSGLEGRSAFLNFFIYLFFQPITFIWVLTALQITRVLLYTRQSNI